MARETDGRPEMPDRNAPDPHPRDDEPSPRGGPAYHLPPKDYPTTGSERVVTVRYGKMRARGRFRSKTPGLIYSDRVVVQSDRGIEVGEIVFDAPRGAESRSEPLGWVVRRASDDDAREHYELNERQAGPSGEFEFCRDRIAALELPMRLVDVERPFGGGKLIFFFTADGRVDFRELVRDLAKRFRTRIEMKQIGVRDEAKVLGEVGDCGRELCCRTFLTRMQPISMRMAKVQKTTLDPTKISGRCGRLKCCLRYEFDAYLSLREALPRSGTRVRHDGRTATVSGMDILSQMVTIVLPSGERNVVHVSTLEPADRRAASKQPAATEPTTEPAASNDAPSDTAPDAPGTDTPGTESTGAPKRKRRKRRKKRPPSGDGSGGAQS